MYVCIRFSNFIKRSDQTATTVLLGKCWSWASGGDVDLACPFFLRAFIEEERFQFLSFASSISICSCLQSGLQNASSPLQRNDKSAPTLEEKTFTRKFCRAKGAEKFWGAFFLVWSNILGGGRANARLNLLYILTFVPSNLWQKKSDISSTILSKDIIFRHQEHTACCFRRF